MPAPSPEPAPQTRLPTSLVVGYGGAGLAISFANTAVMFFALKYLVDGAGMDAATAGWVLLLAKIWDGIIDPLIGRLIDRTRSSWGSRRPWMAGATPALAVLFAALWWGFPLTGLSLAAVSTLLLMGYATAYTLVSVPYGALTPVLTQDYDERTRLNGSRMVGAMLGGIVSAVVFPALVHAASWRVAGIVLGLMTIPPLLWTVWATRGRDRCVAEGEEDDVGLLYVLRSGPFRRTVVLFLAAWSTVNVLASLVPFWVEHHIHRKELTDAFLGVIQVAALVAIPAVVWLAKRHQKHVAYAVSIGSWALVMLAFFFVPEGGLTAGLVVAASAGMGVAAAHVLPWSMLPDAVEADRAATGKDRAGAFYGAMTFLEQVGTAFALWAEGQVLGYAGYIPGAAVQPDSAVTALLWMAGPVPMTLLLGAAFFALWKPPMTREAHRAVVQRLEQPPI